MFQDAITSAIQTIDAGRPAQGGRDGTPFRWDELPGVLVRRAGWIVGSVLTALLAALLLVSILPPSYTANTEVVVQPTDLKAVDGSVNQVSSQPDTSVALVETASRVLGSRKVLDRVIEKLGLVNDPEFVRRPSRLRELVAEVRQALQVETEPPAADPTDDALRQLTKHITIRRSERTFVIDLSVKSEDPAKAARIANAIVDAFLEVQASARAEASRRISDALTSRLGELRDSVRRNEDAVQKFRVANNLVMANGQMVGEQQLSEASNQVLAAANRTADTKAKLDQVDAAAHGRDPGAIPESLQSQTITALRSQLAQVSKQEADARVTFGERHPQLAQIRSQVDAVRRQLDGEVQRIRATARSEYERAKATEATLRTNLGQQQATAAKANGAQIRLRELERDTEASRSVLESFLVRARETAEQERVDTLNAWVMSPAVAPSDRSFPPPNLVVFGAALALGLAGGIAAALLREQTDQRLWTRGRVERVTGLPVLAAMSVPRRLWAQRRARMAEDRLRLDDAGHTDDTMLGVLHELMAGRIGEFGRIVLLLGAEGEKDAGIVAQRLAAAAAAEGHKTTLVGFGPDGRPAYPVRLANEERASVEPVTRSLELPEPAEPGHVPYVTAKLKGYMAEHGAGRLMIIAARRGSPAVAQLAGLADASVLVLTRARSTREEARALVQRLKSKANTLRGAILIGGAA